MKQFRSIVRSIAEECSKVCQMADQQSMIVIALPVTSAHCATVSPSLRRITAFVCAAFVEDALFEIEFLLSRQRIQRRCFACVPSYQRHQGTDMSNAQAQQRRNLNVAGVTINVLSLPDAVSSIVSAAEQGDNFSVCTLNLDHTVQLQQRPEFRAAYRRARFVTADGFPIVVLGRLMGAPIQRTTGADLVEPVCHEAQKRALPVFMLGSNDRTLALTAKRLSERFQGLKIAGYYAPGRNFDPNSSEADFAIDNIRASGARLCFVALGAPRQEVFAARCLDELDGTGMLCIGAALDFIAGTQMRAPPITQRIGLEWAWRMLREPRRLGPRYMRCMAAVPRLVIRTIPQIVDARLRKAA